MDAGERGLDEPLEVLRAKYLDYCSAQIADLLVYLSADEIYLIAHRAQAEGGGETSLGYAEMVRVATGWLARRVALPPFEVWVEDYEAHPRRYEEYLMGLWKSEADPVSDG
ncbi:MAG: hypothetical protein WD995_04315 [Gemmatimonadota bacterium]